MKRRIMESRKTLKEGRPERKTIERPMRKEPKTERDVNYEMAFREGYEQGYEDGYEDGYDDGFSGINESKKIDRKRTLKESKELKLSGSFKVNTKGNTFKEVGFFGFGTQYDAFDFADKNGEGWRLPNESEAEKIADRYAEELSEIISEITQSEEDIVDFNFWTDTKNRILDGDGYERPEISRRNGDDEDTEIVLVR